MRAFLIASLLAFAAAPAAAAEPARAAPAAPAAAHYTTAETDLGTLLDDPAAKTVLARHIPALISNEQIDVVFARDGTVDRRIALPVAVRHTGFLEPLREPDAQLEGAFGRERCVRHGLSLREYRAVHGACPTATRRLGAREPAFSSSRSYSDM